HWLMMLSQARVAKLADAKDLKSFSPQGECGFKSRPGHQLREPRFHITEGPLGSAIAGHCADVQSSAASSPDHKSLSPETPQRAPALGKTASYSCRRAATGSIRDARLAGAYPARIAAIRRTTPANASVLGSLGCVSNRNDLTSRDALNATGTLIASPTTASSRTCRRTIQSTAPRCAPSAMRIPISPTCRSTL